MLKMQRDLTSNLSETACVTDLSLVLDTLDVTSSNGMINMHIPLMLA